MSKTRRIFIRDFSPKQMARLGGKGGIRARFVSSNVMFMRREAKVSYVIYGVMVWVRYLNYKFAL